MRKRPSLSDDFCDAVVELCFRLLPAMDGDDLSVLIRSFLDLADAEACRAAGEAWDACCHLTRRSVAREREKVYDALRKQASSPG